MIDRQVLLDKIPCLIEDRRGSVILLYSFTDKGVTNSIEDYFEGVFVKGNDYRHPRVNIIASNNQGDWNLSNIKFYDGAITIQNHKG